MSHLEPGGDPSGQDDPPLGVIAMEVAAWHIRVDCADFWRRCTLTSSSPAPPAIRIGRIVGIGDAASISSFIGNRIAAWWGWGVNPKLALAYI